MSTTTITQRVAAHQRARILRMAAERLAPANTGLAPHAAPDLFVAHCLTASAMFCQEGIGNYGTIVRDPWYAGRPGISRALAVFGSQVTS